MMRRYGISAAVLGALGLLFVACTGDDPTLTATPVTEAGTADDAGPGTDATSTTDATARVDAEAGPPVATGEVQWVKPIVGGVGTIVVVSATAFDAAGNIVVAGLYASASAVLSFGDGKSLPVNAGLDGFVAKYDGAGTCLWVTPLTGAGDDLVTSVDVDRATGDIVVGGISSAAVTVGTQTSSAPTGGDDMFLARLTPAGAGTWVKMFGGPGADELSQVSVGPTGNILVAGSMKRTTVTSVKVGAVEVFIPPNRTERAAVVLMFDSTGSPAWARGFPTTAAGSDSVANAARFDALGNVVTAGAFTGTIDLRYLDSSQNKMFTSGGARDGFVAKFDANTRQLSWGVQLGGAGDEVAHALALDSTGSSRVVTAYLGALTLGATTLPVLGGVDTAVSFIDPGGTLGTSRGFGSADKDSPAAIAVDPWGSIIIGGEANGSIPFDTKTATAQGARDGFVAKLDPTGMTQWALGVGGGSNDTVTSLAVYTTGEIAVSGSFVGNAAFGTKMATAGGVNNPGGFIAKLKP